MKHNLFKQKES